MPHFVAALRTRDSSPGATNYLRRCLAVDRGTLPAGHPYISDGSYVMARHDDGYLFRQLVYVEGVFYLKTLQEGHSVIELPDLGAIEGVVTQQATRRRADRKHYS